MPITQDRLLAVLTAAEEFQDQVRLAAQAVHYYCSRVQRGEARAEDVIPALAAEVAAMRLPTGAVRVVERERALYNSTRSRNERRQRSKAKKRRDAGVPEARVPPIRKSLDVLDDMGLIARQPEYLAAREHARPRLDEETKRQIEAEALAAIAADRAAARQPQRELEILLKLPLGGLTPEERARVFAELARISNEGEGEDDGSGGII